MKVDSWLVLSSKSIKDAMSLLNAAGTQVLFVVDGSGKLVGSLSDGDIRRALLKNNGLDTRIVDVMNPRPAVIGQREPKGPARVRLRRAGVRFAPVLDPAGLIVDVFAAYPETAEALDKATQETSVVLMAGGEGLRLRPLTETCPKPMLPVGGRPILQTIVESVAGFGFSKFFISVNYKKDQIQNHFKDGKHFGVDIQYLTESSSLGTAGALGLLPKPIQSPVVVMNGDLLTSVDIGRMLAFHLERKNTITIGVRDYEVQVPYGVVRTDSFGVVRVEEKPIQRFQINAGIYILEPMVLDWINGSDRIDMTTLIDQAIEKSCRVDSYLINEYWLDIGRMEDFEQAQKDFSTVFSNLS